MDELLKNLKKFIELRKAFEDLKKKRYIENINVATSAHTEKPIHNKNSPKTQKSETAFKISPPKAMTAGNPVSTGPKTTVTATNSTAMGRGAGFGGGRGGSHIRATTTWKEPSGLGKKDLKKKQKAHIRPDVVSTPELFNEPPTVSRPGVVSGPTMMNVRKHGPADGEFNNPVDMGAEVNETGLRLNEDNAQKYHIYDGKMRVTSKPMTLGEINQRHGPTQKIESSGLRVIPHQPQPLAPQKLRRSSSEK